MSSDITATRLDPLALPATAFRVNEAEPSTAHLENLSTLVAKMAVAEFLAVAAAAYVVSLIYYLAILQSWPPWEAYVSSALFLAGLATLVSLSFRHYQKLQIQPLHRFLWTGISAVVLAFSFF